MKRHLGLALVLLICQATLAPLAYASPTDPVWLAGIYDDDDNDNAVLAATLTDKVVEHTPLAEVSWITPLIVDLFIPDDTAGPASADFLASETRAPPLSSQPAVA